MSKQQKRTKYNCAEKATAEKKISTERTNQGAARALTANPHQANNIKKYVARNEN